MSLTDDKGNMLAQINGVEFVKARREVFLRSLQKEQEGLLYEVLWQPCKENVESVRNSEVDSQEGCWLVFADKSGLGLELASLLKACGQKSIIVSREKQYASYADDHYGVDPEDPGDFIRLFREPRMSVKGLLFLWGIDVGRNTDAAAIKETEAICGSVAYLVRGLTETEGSEPGALWIVTKGAQLHGDGPVAALQSCLWGLGSVLPLEHPELRTRCLDLDPSDSRDQAAMLLQEVLSPGEENRMAFRGGVRLAARLERRPEYHQDTIQFKDDAGYLITGGLGGLGLRVAYWMGHNGARNLILCGRGGADGAEPQEVRRLRDHGARVRIIAADVSDQRDVQNMMKEIKSSMPPLRGIIHAAGIIDDAPLIRQDSIRFRKVMGPKVRGTLNLHTMTSDAQLDFFVCFSSAASIIGSGGQGNYAAANAFMDAFMQERRRNGLHGLSVNWGAWAGSGMAAGLSKAARERIADRGADVIAPDRGLEILGDLLQQDATQACVMAMDWSNYAKSYYGETAPLFFEAVAGPRTARVKTTAFTELLKETPESKRRERLFDYVRLQVAATLGIKSPEQLEPRQRLFDIGIDSLMAVEVKNRLEAGLGIPLRSTVVFDYPTLEALVGHLWELVSPSMFSGKPKEADKAPAGRDNEIDLLLSEIEAISEEELKSRLAGGDSTDRKRSA